MSFSTGAKIGAYTISEKLGQGGMATVYKAHHEKLDRFVAIKVLHAVFKDDIAFLRRFTREAQVVARLEHSHIVPIYDFAEYEGHPYLVMRYIQGETLKETLNRGALSPKEIVHIVTAIGNGLHYAHRQGVLHRDVKPSNILLTTNGGVFIADFGLARITQAGESTLSQDMIMGTPQYISPEQAKGNTELDGRTDIYSFGIIAYEMITGRVPFQADTNYAIIHAQIFDPPPPPSSIDSKISPDMESVLLQVLAKEPQQRFSSAQEFAQAFKTAALDLPTEIASTGLPNFPDRVDEVTSLAQTNVATIDPLPDLPDLTGPPEADVAVPNLAQEKRKSWPLIAGGALLGIFICAALFFIGLRLQQRAESDASTSLATAGATNNAADLANNTGLSATGTTLAPTPTKSSTSDNTLPGSPDRLLDLDFDIFNPRLPAELERLLAADPGNNQLQAELALAYLQDGRGAEARLLIRELIDGSRTAAAITILSARLLENKEYQLAIILLEEGLIKYKDDINLQEMLMMAYILNQQAASRVQEYLDLLRNGSFSADTITIGEAYIAYEQGNLNRSVQVLTSRLAQNPLDFQFDLQFLLGMVHKELGNLEIARTFFQQARANPAIPNWLNNAIMEQLVELGKTRDVIE